MMQFYKVTKILFFVVLIGLSLLLNAAVLVEAQVTYDTNNNAPAFYSVCGINYKSEEQALQETGCRHNRDVGACVSLIDNANCMLNASGSKACTYSHFACAQDETTQIGMDERKELLTAKGPGVGTTIFAMTDDLISQRPYSAMAFINQEATKLVYPGSVYAQDPPPYFPGSGQDLLRPMQEFWGWSTTVAFSFMTLIIIIVALALIFRAKLDGQTVVQLQNAIPGIVLAMILIPLSYPISGLFIDAITVGTNAYHDILFAPGGIGREVYEDSYKSGNIDDDYGQPGTRGLYADDPRITIFNTRNMIGQASGIEESIREVICNGNCANTSVANGLGTIINGLVSFLSINIPSIIGGLIMLIWNILALVTAVRIFWILLKQFISFLFLPVLSPFIFTTLAIPGLGTRLVVNFFLKKMAFSSLAFIITYAMFITAILIATPKFAEGLMPGVQASEYEFPLLGFTAEGINSETGQNVQGGGLELALVLAGFGIYFMIPGLLNDLRDKLAPRGEMPQALKSTFQEVSRASNVAFKQAPEVVGRRYNQAAKTIGGRVSQIGGGTFGENIGKRAEKLGRNLSRIPGVSRVADPILTPLTGKERTSSAAKKEGQEFRFNTSLLIAGRQLSPGSSLNLKEDDYAPAQFTTQSTPNEKIFYGDIRIEIQDESSTLKGPLIFEKKGTPKPNVIAIDDKNNIQLKLRDFAQTGNELRFTGENINGKKDVEIPVELEIADKTPLGETFKLVKQGQVNFKIAGRNAYGNLPFRVYISK